MYLLGYQVLYLPNNISILNIYSCSNSDSMLSRGYNRIILYILNAHTQCTVLGCLHLDNNSWSKLQAFTLVGYSAESTNIHPDTQPNRRIYSRILSRNDEYTPGYSAELTNILPCSLASFPASSCVKHMLIVDPPLAFGDHVEGEYSQYQ